MIQGYTAWRHSGLLITAAAFTRAALHFSREDNQYTIDAR